MFAKNINKTQQRQALSTYQPFFFKITSPDHVEWDTFNIIWMSGEGVVCSFTLSKFRPVRVPWHTVIHAKSCAVINLDTKR